MDSSLTNVLGNFVDMSHIGADSIIIDAGAFLGRFINALRENPEASKCTVIALEANRDNAVILKEKHLTNVKIYRRALVGQKTPKSVLFHQYIGLPGWGSTIDMHVRHKKCKEVRKYKIKALRINDIFDDLGLEYIDFLKMDIEGTEMEVLETMTQKTASRIKQLSAEIHKHPLQESRPIFKKMLERLGYQAQIISVDAVYGIQKEDRNG